MQSPSLAPQATDMRRSPVDAQAPALPTTRTPTLSAHLPLRSDIHVQLNDGPDGPEEVSAVTERPTWSAEAAAFCGTRNDTSGIAMFSIHGQAA